MSVSFGFGLYVPPGYTPPAPPGGPAVEALVLRYRDAALALLPPGRALAKALTSNVAAFFSGCAVEWSRLHIDAETLLANIVPGYSADYLDVWEEALGLPGECVTIPPTDPAVRLAAVRTAILGYTDHSAVAFELAAFSLGYSSIGFLRQSPPLCTGICSQPLYGDEWANVVEVIIEPSNDNDEQLTCIFNHLMRRAHGYLILTFQGGGP